MARFSTKFSAAAAALLLAAAAVGAARWDMGADATGGSLEGWTWTLKVRYINLLSPAHGCMCAALHWRRRPFGPTALPC